MTQDEFEEKVRQLAGKLEESERRCAELAKYVEGCKHILVMHGNVSADYDLAQVLNKYWHLKVKYEPCEVDDFGRPIPPPRYDEVRVRVEPVGEGTIDTWPMSAIAVRCDDISNVDRFFGRDCHYGPNDRKDADKDDYDPEEDDE